MNLKARLKQMFLIQNNSNRNDFYIMNLIYFKILFNLKFIVFFNNNNLLISNFLFIILIFLYYLNLYGFHI